MSHSVLTDDREISAIAWNNAEDECYLAKEGYKIVAYGEPGMHCEIPYFAVKRNGIVIARVPAWQVSVHYKEKS